MRLKNFVSVEPVMQGDKITALTFTPPRDVQAIAAIVERMGNARAVQVHRRAIATVDFGVVTALEDEAEVVEAGLSGTWTERRGGQIYRIGHHMASSGRTYWVAVCRHSKMGSVPAALTSMNLIRDLSPRYVVLLGIAGGRSSEPPSIPGEGAVQQAGQKLIRGDVVYATAISPYEYEKRSVEKLVDGTERPKTSREDRTLQCSSHLVEVADMVRRAWKQDQPKIDGRPTSADRDYPAAFGGTIASGCKVIADEAVLGQLDALQPDNRKLIAIEMEGEGVAEVAHQAKSEFILIKGISDLANREKKDDAWRVYASRAATRFFFDMVNIFPEDHAR